MTPGLLTRALIAAPGVPTRPGHLFNSIDNSDDALALADHLQFMVDITAARVRVLDVNLGLTEIPFAPGDDLAVIRRAITERAAALSGVAE